MAIERYREGRDFETRDYDLIIFGQPQVAHFDIFYNFPKHEIPPGMTYGWANWDTDNLSVLHARGYNFVPASRHPKYVMHQFGMERPQYIYKHNQVLLEIPTKLFNHLRNLKIQKLLKDQNKSEATNVHKNKNAMISTMKSGNILANF